MTLILPGIVGRSPGGRCHIEVTNLRMACGKSCESRDDD